MTVPHPSSFSLQQLQAALVELGFFYYYYHPVSHIVHANVLFHSLGLWKASVKCVFCKGFAHPGLKSYLLAESGGLFGG